MKLADCGVLILAAGRSERFGDDHKLLADFGGRPLGAHAVETALALHAKCVLIAVPADQPKIADAFNGADRFIVPVSTNDVTAEEKSGLGRSLATGVGALVSMEMRVDGVVVLLADMPFVRPVHLDRLFGAMGDASMVFSTPADDPGQTVSADGAPIPPMGPPAIFRQTLFPDLMRLKGDQGARALQRVGAAMAVASLDKRALIDIDTKSDLAHWGCAAGE